MAKAVSAYVEMPDRVSQIAVPSAARALCTLAHTDYEDAFLVDVGPTGERTAEQWARKVLECSPAAVRRTLQAGWSAIGLKLRAGRSKRAVLGWELRRNTPEYVLLGAESRIGMPAELLLKREHHALLFATFVQHDNHLARAAWAAIEPVHVPIVRRVLEQASRRSRP